jgi:hypothetical protein
MKLILAILIGCTFCSIQTHASAAKNCERLQALKDSDSERHRRVYQTLFALESIESKKAQKMRLNRDEKKILKGNTPALIRSDVDEVLWGLYRELDDYDDLGKKISRKEVSITKCKDQEALSSSSVGASETTSGRTQ